jgi:hypothetical protein
MVTNLTRPMISFLDLLYRAMVSLLLKQMMAISVLFQSSSTAWLSFSSQAS